MPKAAFATDAGKVLAVQNLEDQPEPLLHLALPLLHHRWRCGHNDRSDLSAQEELADDQTGFDRLAQPRVVRDEQVDPRQPERLSQRLHLVRIDLDAGAEGGLEQRRVGRGRAAPAEGVQEGGKVAGWVKAALPEVGPWLVVEDGPVQFAVPEDCQLLALGIVVRACEADAGGFAGIGGGCDLLDEPAAGANAHHLADAGIAFGEVGVNGLELLVGGFHEW